LHIELLVIDIIM